MRSTLARLRETDSDVLVPGLASGTVNAYPWTGEQWRALMDHAAAQLAGG